MTHKERYQYIQAVYGLESIIRQTIEECAELQQALCKWLRYYNSEPDFEYGELFENIQEEVADVENCLCILEECGFIDIEDVDARVDEKIKRWYNRAKRFEEIKNTKTTLGA